MNEEIIPSLKKKDPEVLKKLNEYFDDNNITQLLLKEQEEYRYGDVISLTIHSDKVRTIETRAYQNKFKFYIKRKLIDNSSKIILEVKLKNNPGKQIKLTLTKEMLKKENTIPNYITIQPLKETEIENIENYIINGETTDNIISSKRISPSAKISEGFLDVLEHTLTKRNFSGYSPGYKDEFRSKASILFVKHWHKFDPSRARLNYYQKQGELFYKEPHELRGAFGWFSLFSKTGIVDEIKRLKKIRDKNKEIIELKNLELAQMDSYMYQ